MNEDKKKEYFKKYYQDHKDKMDQQLKASRSAGTRRKVINKLNNNEYERIPYSKLLKYNIIFDENKKIYN